MLDDLWPWFFGVSIGTLVLSALVMPWFLARLPADYFTRPHTAATGSLTLRVVKNAFGAVLLVAGVAMLVLPGQGILTMLAGLALLEFPGKRRLELALVRRPAIARAIRWVRRRTGRPPLEIPERRTPGDSA